MNSNSQNGIPFTLGNTLSVGIYPFPSAPSGEVFVLDLERADKLVVIASGEELLENVDAAVTARHDATLAIRTRDCAPICFGDGKRIGIAHIGWQGFSMGLVEKTLQYFNPETLVVYVGPFMHSFEIQKDFCYDALIKKAGAAAHIVEYDGKLVFEFQKAIAELLPENTLFDTRNTFTDPDLPSYRRDKDSKGFLTTVSFAK